eukprot:TRINITY_DN12312_c0_g1_i2.p1 TRINITY_DN12312_c0_g1~~TRINITY_DN12312_c0_g1_i2.p1  ORF type:complete len:305 (+),score=83.86 TRINITY_DN12312_c0_g1_i2:105-1019(+)
MGIPGLLPCLRSIEEQCHISAFRGRRVGVDTYCWLHKLCRANARELSIGEACTQYIHNVVMRVEYYLRQGVELVMVFDGADMPLKGGTNTDRKTKRKNALQKAALLEQQGRTMDARAEYMSALEITPEVAQSLIAVVKEMGVECIVAPYEADAQLAFLARTHYIDVVVTEDSDLLAYMTPQVFLKGDHNGKGVVIRASRLVENTELPLASFSEDMLLTNLILAGCDYSQSLYGIGIKKANKLVGEHKTLSKIIDALRTDSRYASCIKNDSLSAYEYEFLRAFFAFRHHIVYDPIAIRLSDRTVP